MKYGGNNEQATKAQRQAYGQGILPPQKLSGGETEIGEDNLRLLEQDGWDGDNVTGLPAAQIDLFFQGSPVWPDERDILRIGLFFHDGFFDTLALILKGNWERFLYERNEQLGAAVAAKSADDETCLIEFSQRIEELVDCNQLFDMMQQHQRYAEKNGFDRVSLLNLVHAMVIARLQTAKAGGPELKAFSQNQVKEKTDAGRQGGSAGAI